MYYMCIRNTILSVSQTVLSGRCGSQAENIRHQESLERVLSLLESIDFNCDSLKNFSNIIHDLHAR